MVPEVVETVLSIKVEERGTNLEWSGGCWWLMGVCYVG
jgi:hypothetical protein